MTTPIVIDCDPGHDDAIAILLALASPEVELVGVTTVAGNQTLDKTTRNALVTLEIAGRSDIPVAVGAETPLGETCAPRLTCTARPASTALSCPSRRPGQWTRTPPTSWRS